MSETDAQPSKPRYRQGQQAGHMWAAMATPDEKDQVFNLDQDRPMNMVHASWCAEIARWLKLALFSPQIQLDWPTLYPFLAAEGFTEMSSADTWLIGFVDGALDEMGLKPLSP